MSQTEALAQEIALLRREVALLNAHRFIRVQNSFVRMVAFQLLRGMALGLGTAIGATVLLSMVIYMLSEIDFIPVVGDWALQIVTEIESQRE